MELRQIGEIPNDRLPLAMDWVEALFDSSFGVGQRSIGAEGGTLTLVDKTTVTISLEDATLRVETDDPSKHADLERIANEAQQRTLKGDLGDGVWWRASLHAPYGVAVPPDIHFVRAMSEHQLYKGEFRMSDTVFLDFDPGEVKSGVPRGLQTGTLSCRAVFWTPGPAHGEFAGPIARRWGSLIKGLCSFATGCPFESPGILWPAKQDESDDASRKLPTLREIAFQHVPLLPSALGLAAGGIPETIERFQGALFSYEVAIVQKSAAAATILFVTAMEALTIPNAPWRRERVTKRFVEFIDQLCPEAIDTVMDHANFKETFGELRSRKLFLEHVYNMRSRPLHQGLASDGIGWALEGPRQTQIAFLSELTKAAIVAFLKAPRSSLIGHPNAP